ncbi:ATP-binding protein [Aquamicrobium sp. LC103]|uniref:ATP-binding protein n=1 Tax=Aquamicrobium sp. LC103 TaxID=1120658 RepID=UPI00063E90CB|nr:ATP-binding protein [Aquamicrobium sp. LC103]TKT74218.1 two-component sensor histidine kinase [Aquamicrobium sp. LC103]
MVDATRAKTGRRMAALARARLYSARWPLMAAAAAILAVGVLAGGRLWHSVLAMFFVVIVAVLAPRRAFRRDEETSAAISHAGDMAGMSALDLAAAVPDPLIIFDRNGSTVHANQAALSAFEPLPTGSLMQLKFRAPEIQQLFLDVREGKPAAVVDYAEKVPIERVYRVAAMPVGENTGLFAVLFKDQSESRRIDRMRADFIANASHELRTPLASISGFIETLRGPARNDEKARENFLQIMQTQTERMARLIDDLLSLSRLEMRPHVKSAGRVDLVQLVGSVADSLNPLAKESGLVFDKTFPDHAVEVSGNRDELIQVFENLLENACKYGQSGKRVEVAIEETMVGPRPEAAVTVRDFGPGIAEEHIPRVTERFYRVDVETSRSQKGTGLGLAIVKHILTRHDGRLTIKSEVGKGAAFTVYLPLR